MPWKNGGGDTTEIRTDPEGAGLEDFTWRLSAARVARDGPFSLFPGVDRTLAVLSGDGLALQVAGTEVRLAPGDAPFSFPGDAPTEGRLLGGPVEDLNIMTRRGVARHRMQRVPVEGGLSLSMDAATLLLFCAEGQVSFNGETLAPRDTAILDGKLGSRIQTDGRGVLYVIEVERAM